MYFRKYLFTILFAAALIFIFTAHVNAAVLSLVPEAKTVGVGQEFSVDIKVNTEGVGINGSQATIAFPNNVLTLMSTDRRDSVFNFWVEEPVISNEDGTMHFIGGTPKGVVGSSLQILRMKFKASGAGLAELSLSNAVVTASDGKGTNVLSSMEGMAITVGTKIVVPAKEPVAQVTLEPVVEQPKKVVREAVLAKGLPQKPKVKIPLYPNEAQWYNQIGEVTALWDVPEDISAVVTKLDKNPNTKPTELEKELFTGKNFGMLKEGIWYIHVRFKNNVGLGETTHYKISLDTSSPLLFKIEIDNFVSDNPAPEIKYKTQDSLSGIAGTDIFVDGIGPLKTQEVSLKLPSQKPGNHALIVKVLDRAGNSVQDNLEFEILPLPTPTIDFVTKSVAHGDIVFASGKTLPNAFVDVKIIKGDKEVLSTASPGDSSGNWSITIQEPLAVGTYAMRVSARDSRSAQSFPSDPMMVKVTRKPVISLGIIDLGWLELSLIFILLVTSGVSTVAWYYISAKKKRGAYQIIVGRDIEKLGTLLEKDLAELQERCAAHIDPKFKPETEILVKKLADTIMKMKKYLTQEVEKLK